MRDPESLAADIDAVVVEIAAEAFEAALADDFDALSDLAIGAVVKVGGPDYREAVMERLAYAAHEVAGYADSLVDSGKASSIEEVESSE